MFVGHFMANKRQNKMLASLWSIGQGPNETLRSYTKRFTMAYLDVMDLNENFTVQAFRVGVANEHVHYALCGTDITDMEDLIVRAQTLAMQKK